MLIPVQIPSDHSQVLKGLQSGSSSQAAAAAARAAAVQRVHAVAQAAAAAAAIPNVAQGREVRGKSLLTPTVRQVSMIEREGEREIEQEEREREKERVKEGEVRALSKKSL